MKPCLNVVIPSKLWHCPGDVPPSFSKPNMTRFLVSFAFLCLATGCSSGQSSDQPAVFEPVVRTLENGESSHIVVQHVLIAFTGTLPGKAIKRTREEAAVLAKEVLDKAQAGENFGKLVEDYTDDSPPGIYRMANFGEQSFMKAAKPQDNVFPRDRMVPAFGDVGFPLEVGEIGMSEYDPAKSPFGWHIVKRLK